MMNRKADIERFYELMERLNERVGGPHLLKHFMSVVAPTEKGVYFIFEPAEFRCDASEELRVVRVGSHGLTARSRSTIWTRLFEHQMANGRSVFRTQINQALKKRGVSEAMNTAHSHSHYISKYIGEMRFLWVNIEGEKSHSERKRIEANAIALLSNRNKHPINLPSKRWLGNYSAKREIRKSGLWNVQHTNNDHKSGFLEELKTRIEQMRKFT